MKAVSDFRLLEAIGKSVTVTFDGKQLELREGENLAACLLAAGVMPFRRTAVSGSPRNPFCMMGACYDCLVEIDGVTKQACMSEVIEGMRINMPVVTPSIREDDHV